MDEWISKMHKGILKSHKKEENSVICNNLDEPGYAKWKAYKDKYYIFSLMVSKTTKLIETESRIVVTRSWKIGIMGSYWLKDTKKGEISFWSLLHNMMITLNNSTFAYFKIAKSKFQVFSP